MLKRLMTIIGLIIVDSDGGDEVGGVEEPDRRGEGRLRRRFWSPP